MFVFCIVLFALVFDLLLVIWFWLLLCWVLGNCSCFCFVSLLDVDACVFVALFCVCVWVDIVVGC